MYNTVIMDIHSFTSFNGTSLHPVSNIWAFIFGEDVTSPP